MTETVWETETARCVIVRDEYPEEPYDDGAAPILGFDYGMAGWVADQKGGTSYVVPDSIYQAAARFGPNNGMLERYLRMWHGVTMVERYDSRSYTYMAFDPAEWRESLGAPENSVSMTEWRAYCEGDVYGIVVEDRVEWSAPDGRTRTEWEPRDSVWGFYGEEWARQGANEYFPEGLAA